MRLGNSCFRNEQGGKKTLRFRELPLCSRHRIKRLTRTNFWNLPKSPRSKNHPSLWLRVWKLRCGEMKSLPETARLRSVFREKGKRPSPSPRPLGEHLSERMGPKTGDGEVGYLLLVKPCSPGTVQSTRVGGDGSKGVCLHSSHCDPGAKERG